MRILLIALLSACATGAAAEPRAVLRDDSYRFGTVVRGTVLEHDFVLRNDGAVPLRIARARMSTPLRATRLPAEVAARSETALGFRLETAELEGVFDGRIVLTLDDPAVPEAAFAFEGRIVPPIEMAPSATFFVSAPRGERRDAALEIINHEPAPLRIVAVEHPPERFATELTTLEEGRRFRLRLVLNADGPGGRSTDTIRVITTSTQQPVLTVRANTYLRERVYSFPDAVDFGAIPLADIQSHPDLLERAAQTLMVYRSGGKDFRVEAASGLPAVHVETERGPAGDRYQLTLTLIAAQLAPGPLRGALRIRTNDPEFPALTVPVSGFIR